MKYYSQNSGNRISRKKMFFCDTKPVYFQQLHILFPTTNNKTYLPCIQSPCQIWVRLVVILLRLKLSINAFLTLIFLPFNMLMQIYNQCIIGKKINACINLQHIQSYYTNFIETFIGLRNSLPISSLSMLQGC